MSHCVLKLLCILYTLSFLVSGCRAAGVSDEELRKLNDAWEEAKWADFVVAGEVVDQEGKRVPQANLLICFNKRGLGSSSSEKNESIVSADGTFRIEKDNSSYLEIYAYKEGYFKERLTFRPGDRPEDWTQRVLRGEKPKPGKVVRDHLRVVLEKHGPLADLSRDVAGLRIGVDGRGRIWDLTRFGGYETKVANWQEESKFPSQCIYFLTERGENGKFVYDTINNVRVPRRVRIVWKGEGGFVAAASQTNATKAYRSMKEAPETGYLKEMVFTSEQLIEHRKKVAAIGGEYFYYKTDKGYGKGALAVYWHHDETEITVDLTLRFQKNGSRLLATED